MTSGAETRPYRMGARAEAAESTLDRVLDAAFRLFTDNPYEEVSLERVAEEAEVTKRTVLRRFGSKEALFGEAMQLAADEMIAHRNAAPVGDVAGAVANVVGQYERWGDNRLRLLSQEDRIPLIAEWVQGGREWHWAWVERIFAPQLKGLRGAARKRRVAALVVLTDVYTWRLLRLDLKLSRAETERTLVDLINRRRRLLMARYLAYTSPARGHLYPLVSTLLELRERGHDVHVRTLASELDALRALGLHAEPIAAAIEAAPFRDFEASSPQEGLGKALETFATAPPTRSRTCARDRRREPGRAVDRHHDHRRGRGGRSRRDALGAVDPALSALLPRSQPAVAGHARPVRDRARAWPAGAQRPARRGRAGADHRR